MHLHFSYSTITVWRFYLFNILSWKLYKEKCTNIKELQDKCGIFNANFCLNPQCWTFWTDAYIQLFGSVCFVLCSDAGSKHKSFSLVFVCRGCLMQIKRRRKKIHRLKRAIKSGANPLFVFWSCLFTNQLTSAHKVFSFCVLPSFPSFFLLLQFHFRYFWSRISQKVWVSSVVITFFYFYF